VTTIGVINRYEEEEGGTASSVTRTLRPKPDEAPLILSKKAQDRAYFPEGILNHHHAVQFITFSPPFELTTGLHDDFRNVHVHSQHSQNDNYHDDALSCSLDSEVSDLNRLGTNVVASLVANEKNPSRTVNGLPLSPKSVTNLPPVDPSDKASGQAIKDSHRGHIKNQGVETAPAPGKYKLIESSQSGDDGPGGGGVRGLISKLNCCRTKETSMLSNRQGHQLKHHLSSSYGSNVVPESSFTSLSEEVEQRWLAYSMQPIAEDQSLAGGHSVVSMSAPLLSPTPAPNPSKQQQHGHKSATMASQQQPQQQPQSSPSTGNGCGFNKITSEF
jgi:hypothetical protein